jgi:uncharacterized membrane protein (Fun14 family)
MNGTAANASRNSLSNFQKLALASLVVLLIASVAARAMYLSTHEAQSPPGANSALQPDNYLATGVHSSQPSTDPVPEPGAVEKSLPYVTEGSLFGLVGFALGYATRKIFKLALFVVALVFIAIQALTYFNVMTVEWGPVVTWLNKSIFNLAHDESVTSFFTKRVPSIGAMAAGYFLGFKRG